MYLKRNCIAVCKRYKIGRNYRSCNFVVVYRYAVSDKHPSLLMWRPVLYKELSVSRRSSFLLLFMFVLLAVRLDLISAHTQMCAYIELPTVSHLRIQSPYFYTFMEPRKRFQGMNSATLCSLVGRYDNSYSVPSPHSLFKNSRSEWALQSAYKREWRAKMLHVRKEGKSSIC